MAKKNQNNVAEERLQTLIENWNRKEAGGRKKLKRIGEAVGYRG